MDALQEFLDNQQYTKRSISRYERIYGKGSVSTGGMHRAEDLINILSLKQGESVLDVGTGIGGQAFHMAKLYKVKVTGIDFSNNMLHIARTRFDEQPLEIQKLVQFKRVDVNAEELPKEEFDVIHCRDVMMHVSEKKLWIEKFFRTLKPGGRVIVSDYFRGDKENSEEFENYVQSRKYCLTTINNFEQLFGAAGFVSVRMENKSKDYGEILEDEIKRLKENKEKYVEEFSDEEYGAMMNSWKAKLKRNKTGDHQWGFVYAEKN